MINVLIVEDDESKYIKVKNSLVGININEGSIVRTTNVYEALEILKNSKFDILILDLQIPSKPNETKISNQGGLNLLKTIKHDLRKKNPIFKIPNTIIGLSKHPELLELQSNSFSQLRVFSYLYDETDNSSLASVMDYVQECILTKQTSVDFRPSKKIIYSIHGIMTFGSWQNNFGDYLANNFPEFEHLEYKYNFFPVISFLIPLLRNKEVKCFVTELQNLANKNRTSEVYIVAHSFGTYVAIKSLEQIPLGSSPRIEKIILCGSVLKSSHQLQIIVDKFSIKGILNECGIRDLPLVLSQVAAIGLGMAGKVGFKNTYSGLIVNRYYDGGHGVFFKNDFFKSWLDFFSGDIPVEKHCRKDPNFFGLIKQTFLVYGHIIFIFSLFFLFIYFL